MQSGDLEGNQQSSRICENHYISDSSRAPPIVLSLLQRNYAKLAPILKEFINNLVIEDNGEDSGPLKDDQDFHQLNGQSELIEEQEKTENIDMRNLLGFLNQNLYHDYLNITNIMKLKRLDFRDVYGIRSTDLMLTRENIIERIMLLITAYFCMGTELRFLKQMNIEGFKSSKNKLDGEFWHGKALELAVKFLPGDAPLVKHIVSSYQKHHAPSQEIIPEDEEVT